MEQKELKFAPVRERTADIVVIGGGPSGVCAAISAARMGLKVLIVEQGGCFGGMATRGLVGPFMTCYDRTGERMILKGLFSEIVDRLVERKGALHPSGIRSGTGYTSWITVGHDHVTPFDPEILKRLLDEMLIEANVSMLLHTSFISVVQDQDTVTGAILFSKGGFEKVSCRILIDCTGDGDAAVSAGVPFELGNEKLRIMQPATMFFRICNVDDRKLESEVQAHLGDFYRKDGVNYRSLHWLVSKARENGDWDMDRVSIGIYKSVKPDEWCLNTSRIMNVDATDNESVTKGEVIGRYQADEIFRFLKKYVPGCENAKLMCTASTLGIRESRHIRGLKTLTIEEILTGKTPQDSIMVCSNSADVHGRYGPKSNEYMPMKEGNWYGVPYGTMVPEGKNGLLVAGRCFSATSEAAGAVRVMPPCMCMGQAAGTAAAIAVMDQKNPAEVDVKKLRGQLRKDQAFLPEE
jgi:hypothetical protein